MHEYFSRLSQKEVAQAKPVCVGKISRVVGFTLEARGVNVPLGTRCLIELSGQQGVEAEVVGFDGDRSFLMPLKPLQNLSPGARVVPLGQSVRLPAGDSLLGRVLDGLGSPLDGKPIPDNLDNIQLYPEAINPLHRMPIRQPLDVGIRSINATLSLGRGQRVGLFAGSGVGKSVMLGMMTRFTEADVVVVALVGERGREVREFIEDNLGESGMAKAIVVASPADETPVLRMRAGMYAARIAEYFRDRGRNVLLLFDSLTRYAQAQREIALAAGEPPATRGYPPSVFSVLPQLVERAGNGVSGSGSVTAIYTVLTEGDDINDPVADAARAILDGHIVLSRKLAGEGIYPAIDITHSISRAMQNIVDDQQFINSTTLKQWISRYDENRDLISVGAYTSGIDEITDQAIACQPLVRKFLSQSRDMPVDFATSILDLDRLVHTASAQGGSAESAEAGNETGPAAAPALANV